MRYQILEIDAIRAIIVELSNMDIVSERFVPSLEENRVNECELSNRDYRLIYGILPGGNLIVVSIEPRLSI